MGAGAEQNHQHQPPEAVQPPTIPNPNRITPSQFLNWKRQKDTDASVRKAEEARKRAEDIASGLVSMNGRELFQQEPWVFDNSRY
ncbi:hypothetical protein M9H77_31918 [Catharanthus roseus]|uniref:Uncharacterized protein n=1 Tax=Catharanthus roseus TaxID=4058 RepID=A0ACC0A1U5_CATRO|nr:hypothetical protein M9H77_31918 [Catharanthus roseus]